MPMWFSFWFGCDGKQEIKHFCSACNKVSLSWHTQNFASSAILNKIGYLVFCLGCVNEEVNFTHLKQLQNVGLGGSSWELEQDSESSGIKPREFCGTHLKKYISEC